jgi:hypothetical protein
MTKEAEIMGGLDFHLEFQTEVEHLGDELIEEADRRLRALAEGHSDMIGASVSMEELTGGATPYVYQARVIAFTRPHSVVAVEKSDSPEGALKGALSAVERQVREKRDRLRKQWQQPPQSPQDTSLLV